MRTKTLVCAAILAAGLASSMAQSNVYSLNVVGYYNVVIPGGTKVMVANQLNTTNKPLVNNQKRIRGYTVPVPIFLSQMGINGEDGDIAFQFHGGYSASPYDTDASEWSVDFSNQVGEALFILKGAHT